MNWYFDVLKRYAEFGGRAGRSEFWMFTLINALVSFTMVKVGHVAGIESAVMGYALIVLVPALAVGSRRLHDTGMSGWWQLIGLVPWIGLFALVFLYARAGLPGDNRYGPEARTDVV